MWGHEWKELLMTQTSDQGFTLEANQSLYLISQHQHYWPFPSLSNICDEGQSNVQVPISYEQLFRTKVFCTAFTCSQFGFVIFWQKDFGAKAAHKMLVKLTPGLHSLAQNNQNRLAVTNTLMNVTLLGQTPGLIHKHQTRLKRLAIRTFVIQDVKSFITLVPGRGPYEFNCLLMNKSMNLDLLETHAQSIVAIELYSIEGPML